MRLPEGASIPLFHIFCRGGDPASDISDLSGCSIEWMRHSDKERRLIDWLKNHPAERMCLFDQDVYRELNKAECAISAAEAIFADDENPYNSREVRNNPRPFAQPIRNHIRLGWRIKYQKVNARLGPIAARLEYSDFVPGSEVKRIADNEIVKFPQWPQLHVWWRESPQFNQFAGTKVGPEQTAVSSSGKNDNRKVDNESIHANRDFRRKRKRSNSDESDDAPYVPSGPPDSVARRSKKGLQRSKPKHIGRRSTAPSSGSGVDAPPTNTARIVIDPDEGQKRTADDATSGLIVSQFTPDQQIELAKIQRDMQVEQNKAIDMTQKREVLMMLFGHKST